MSAPTVTRWIYDFAEGSRDMRELLGGKGANIAEMTRVLGPELVPAGFTITTEACVAYMRGGRVAPEGLAEAVDEALARLEAHAGRRLGDPDDPLLLSVRSGARDSMPGMMDTVLNLGLNDASVEASPRAPATSASPGTPTAGSCRCSATSSAACRASASRTRSRARQARSAACTLDTELDAEALRSSRGASRRSTTSRPTRASSSSSAIDGGVRLVERRARDRLPPHQRHPRRLGHRRQRAADGVRQPRPRLGLGRRVLARRGHRRARAERRLPARRAGRGRRLRRAHAARPRRAATTGCPRSTPRLLGDPAHARAPLRRHAGHRVHGRGGAPLHAADAQRQAARAGGRALRRRRRRARACSPARRRSRRSTPARSTRCCTRRSTRTPSYEVVARGVAASPGAAKGAIVFTARGRRRGRRGGDATSSSCGRSPRPTTSPASTPPRASSPPRAARPRTRRSWRAAWAARP